MRAFLISVVAVAVAIPTGVYCANVQGDAGQQGGVGLRRIDGARNTRDHQGNGLSDYSVAFQYLASPRLDELGDDYVICVEAELYEPADNEFRPLTYFYLRAIDVETWFATVEILSSQPDYDPSKPAVIRLTAWQQGYPGESSLLLLVEPAQNGDDIDPDEPDEE